MRVMVVLLGLALVLVGTALFFWPSVSAWQAQREMSGRIEVALERDAEASAPVGSRPKESDPAYQYLAEYNQAVSSGTAESINDPFGLGSDEFELGSVGIEDGVVGSVAIPAMNVRLPIYLGASDEHLALGAAVISGTSAPIGGTNGNCVLAAHRGEWSGVPMFRDIESVRVGDLVVVETPWDVLVYRAAELKVITPTDTKSVSVQPGRDLLTLFTCHPYGANYQRYLVICERDLEAERAYAEGDGDTRDQVAGATSPMSILMGDVMRLAEPCESPRLRFERALRVMGLVLLLAALLVTVRAILGALRHEERTKAEGHRGGAHFRS